MLAHSVLFIFKEILLGHFARVTCIIKPDHTKLKIFLPRCAVFQCRENKKRKYNRWSSAGLLMVPWIYVLESSSRTRYET